MNGSQSRSSPNHAFQPWPSSPMLRKPIASAARPSRSVGMPANHTNPTRPMAKAAYAAIRTLRQSALLRVAGAEAEGTRGCYVPAGNSLGR